MGDDNISLEANNNSLKCEITSKHKIDFRQARTIGTLLGFSPKILDANKIYKSDISVDIIRLNIIMINCNLVSGAYINDKEIHTIYQFAPTTPPGYKIIEVPQNVIYLPVKTKLVDNITVTFVDQEGRLVNFRGETVTIRLHLKHGLSI
mgnify:CR=1 FL=1